jgi:DNA-binding CsgD family transcriptional regulator
MRSLQADEARTVLIKNQENIVRKAASGKVLTAPEKAILESIVSKSLTAQELADELGISRRTIFYLRRNADGPAGTNLEEWQEFLEARAILDDSGQNDNLLPEELQKTKARLLRAQAGKEEALRKLKELELEQQEKQLVPSSAAQEVIKKVLGPVRSSLDSLPKLVAHTANPSDPLLAESAIEEGLDSVFRQIEKHAKAKRE